MRSPARRSDDDADVIRARLRALLAEGRRTGGWVPDDEDVPARDTGGTHGRTFDDDDDPWDDAVDPDRWELDRDPATTGPDVGRHRAPGRTARVAPDRPAAWALWAAAALAVLAVLGWTWLRRPDVEPVTAGSSTVPTFAATAGHPRGTPTPPTPTAVPTTAPAQVVVSVVGKVGRPGLVTLPAGSRVADAVAAAGGLLPEADPAAVNAAAVLADGQQIAVGVPGAAPAATAGSGSAAAGGPVDLNTATAADLDALPGVGPVLAQRIVDYRTEHGPFTSVEQLDDVSGIGPAIYAQLAAKVRV